MKHFRTPTAIQFESTECGAVSLYIILGFYGKWLSLEELRKSCQVGRDGANLANTAKAAQSFDLDVELFQFDAEELERAFKSPCIIFWNRNHFLVVEGFGRGRVYLSDPARGKRKVTRSEFEEGFSHFCLFLKPSDTFEPSGKQPSLLKRLLLLVGKRNIPGLLLSLFLGLVTTLPTLGISAVSTFFTDTVLSRIGNVSNGYIWILLLFTFLTMLSSELMFIINRRLQTSMNEGVLDSFFRKIFSMPIMYYAQRDMGEMANRITISSKLSVALTGPLSDASIGMTQIVVYAMALLFFSPWLTLLLLILVVFQILLTIIYMSEIDNLSKRSSISNGRMASSILYITSNSEQVKGNGIESELFGQWADAFAEFTNASSKTSLISQYSNSATTFINNISDYLVIAAGGALILKGDLSIASFVGMRILTQGIFAPLGSATAVITAVKSLAGDVDRLYDVFDNISDQICISLEDEITRSSLQTKETSGDEVFYNISKSFEPSLSFKGISFSYQTGKQPILSALEFHCPPGSLTAICGPSGCGKSTLLRLIAGIMSPTEGEIYIGGKNANEIPKEILLDSISYVDTEIYIMNDSIMSNVTLLDPSYSAEDVISALKKAHIYSDVARLPAGIENILQADGEDLSGGQKQRIQLARAFLRMPLITLLDEATSALDNETEQKVIAELIKTSSTLIAATHRNGLLSIADQIIFLSQAGTITQIGNFDTLQRDCPEFRNMFCSDKS